MDPRRARDPRLARADPRLRVQSGSPAPPAPPALVSQNAPSPQLESEGFYSFENQNQENQVNNIQSQPSSSTYKPRPLFCVVCASNQVWATTRLGSIPAEYI